MTATATKKATPKKKAAPKKPAKKGTKKVKAMLNTPPNTHKWDKWFDGKKHTLKNGKDFNCTERSFTIYAYNRARKRGVKIEVKNAGKGVLTIRAKSAKEIKDAERAAAKQRKAG